MNSWGSPRSNIDNCLTDNLTGHGKRMLQHAQIHRAASCPPVHLSAQFLVSSVTVWQCFPEVPLSHSASIGMAQGHVKTSTWPPQHSRAWAVAPTSAFLSSYLAESLLLIFRPRHHFQLRGAPAVPGLLALLLATVSAEGSHHIFNWPDSACNFALFSCPLLRRTL